MDLDSLVTAVDHVSIATGEPNDRHETDLEHGLCGRGLVGWQETNRRPPSKVTKNDRCDRDRLQQATMGAGFYAEEGFDKRFVALLRMIGPPRP